MSTPLQSAKYLSPEYFQDAYAPPGESMAGSYPAGTAELISPRTAPRWTGGLTFIVFVCGLLGAAGVVGGMGEVLSMTMVDQSAILQEAYAESAAHAQLLQKVLNAQSQNKVVIMFNVGLRILVGIGFIAACVMLLRKRPNANSFAVMMFACAIFYNATSVLVTWLIMPSMSEIPGLDANAAGIAQGVMVGTVLFVVFLKSGIYAAIMAYLSKANTKALFASAADIAAVA